MCNFTKILPVGDELFSVDKQMVKVFDPRTVQPVASRYTDWATRPIKQMNTTKLIIFRRDCFVKPPKISNGVPSH
jgi:hypothetical protein